MDSPWRVFDPHQLLEAQQKAGQPYHEFLRVPSLSCGIYRLARGATDLQGAHDEDEVYHVLEGRGRVRIGGSDYTVGPGSVIYVAATSEHSFFEVEEEMALLVFFATGTHS